VALNGESVVVIEELHEQIMVTKFTGIYISATFSISTTVHVEQILSVAN